MPYPGDREIEWRIKCLVRWNAMAMVVRANKHDANIGGHLATYASLATLVEVGYNHFFRGSYQDPTAGKVAGDFVYFQGHASPGVYSRAFLEGRLSEQHLENFRHELRDHPGLVVLSAPLADAGFLAVPDGFDGPGADRVDLSGALHALSGESRRSFPRPSAKFGRFWATAKRMSRNRWAR